MSLEDYTHAVVDFVRAHQAWAAPIVGALAFGESLAFISLLLPAWAMLVAIGAVISGSGISFWPILTAAAIGAALGDWLASWIGLKIRPAVGHMWPLSRHPELIPRGGRFGELWGPVGVMVPRVFGPLRASVPLGAGGFAL